MGYPISCKKGFKIIKMEPRMLSRTTYSQMTRQITYKMELESSTSINRRLNNGHSQDYIIPNYIIPN